MNALLETQVIYLHPIKVIELVSDVFSVSVPVIVSKDRHRSIVRARLACYYALRQKGFSFPEIGRALFRDHTTVINGLKTVNRLKDSDSLFKAALVEIERSL